MEKQKTVQPNIECYTVSIRYFGNRTIENLLREGKYNWINANVIDENFPTEKTGMETIDIFIIPFNKLFGNGRQIVKELDGLGYKPATPAQLLALGIKYPDLQRRFFIAALGQCWLAPIGFRCVLFLLGSIGGRDVDIYWFMDKWDSRWRFAAVRKYTQTATSSRS